MLTAWNGRLGRERTPTALDLLNEKSTVGAAQAMRDVTVLVNSAGAATGANPLTDDLDAIRQDLETHFHDQRCTR
ncbi:hypothetical protein AB0L85_31390 [Streptomyces sp. NPDC052051]|uniref:hypothetical protein n=1 Tax=Streptomyces sp. NPDC052051 TaxID=3154649 RepID=UPI003423C80D